MKIRVVLGRELSHDLVQAWTQVQQMNPALHNPFFCPHFTQAVAEVRDDVFVGVLEDGGKHVGFFPFQRSRLGVGRPVAGALSDFHGAIAAPELKFDAIELIRRCSLSTWVFDYLPASQGPFERFQIKHLPSPYMDLSTGFEVYAKARRDAGSEQIKKTDNLRRRIEREIGPLRFVAHHPNRAALRLLMSWKTAQYLASGTTDVFSCGWTIALLDRLLDTQKPEFAGMLSCLYVGDRMIAAHMGMRSGSTWHYWFPSYDKEFARFSPGLVLLLAMAEDAPRKGLTTIDLGKGDALYKQRLASGSTQLAQGCVEAAIWAPVVRSIRANVLAIAADPRLPGAIKIPAKVFRRVDRWRRFR